MVTSPIGEPHGALHQCLTAISSSSSLSAAARNPPFELRSLLFTGCTFGFDDEVPEDASLFATALKGFTSLQELSLRRCELTDETLAKVLGPEGILELPKLISLDLSHNDVGPLSVTALTRLVLSSSSRPSPHLAKLHWSCEDYFFRPFLYTAIFGIECDDINDAARRDWNTIPAPALSPSSSFSSLRWLDLSNSDLVNNDIQFICNCFTQQSRRLCIGHDYGTSSSVGATTELSPNHQEPTGTVLPPSQAAISSFLRTLDLRSNSISDVGATTIAQSLWALQGLETLDLRDNKISRRGIAALTVALEGLYSPRRHCSSCRSSQCCADCQTATAREYDFFKLDGSRSLWNIHLDHPSSAFRRQLVLRRLLSSSSSLPHPNAWPLILERTGEFGEEHGYHRPQAYRLAEWPHLPTHSIAYVSVVYTYVRHFGLAFIGNEGAYGRTTVPVCSL